MECGEEKRNVWVWISIVYIHIIYTYYNVESIFSAFRRYNISEYKYTQTSSHRIIIKRARICLACGEKKKPLRTVHIARVAIIRSRDASEYKYLYVRVRDVQYANDGKKMSMVKIHKCGLTEGKHEK